MCDSVCENTQTCNPQVEGTKNPLLKVWSWSNWWSVLDAFAFAVKQLMITKHLFRLSVRTLLANHQSADSMHRSIPSPQRARLSRGANLSALIHPSHSAIPPLYSTNKRTCSLSLKKNDREIGLSGIGKKANGEPTHSRIICAREETALGMFLLGVCEN